MSENNYQEVKTLIGKKLKFLRTKLGLTQSQFASKYYKITPGYLSEVEHGIKDIPVKLCIALIEKGINVNWLLSISELKTGLDFENVGIQRLYEIPEDYGDIVDKYMRLDAENKLLYAKIDVLHDVINKSIHNPGKELPPFNKL